MSTRISEARSRTVNRGQQGMGIELMGKAIIAVLEIGTSNTVALIGEVLEGGRVRISGFGSVKTAGVRKGLITDLTQAQAGVRSALTLAEDMASVSVGEVLLAVSGGHISSTCDEGKAPIRSADGKVTREDIDAVRELAREHQFPGQTILHALPQSYQLDDMDDILNPEGMRGKQLRLGSIFIHGQQERIEDARNLLKGLALDTRDIAFSALAAATAVLTDDQRSHGVLLIDLGGGTTNFVLIHRKVVVAAGSFGVGGDHITNDIAQAFGIRANRAEELKLSDGCAVIDAQRAGQRIEMPLNVIAGPLQSVSVRALHTVIEARMRETLELIRDQLGPHLRQAGSGVVFTGGGAYLPRLNELAERIFGVPAQTGELISDIEGVPRDKVRPAALATVAGLLIRSAQTQSDGLADPVGHFVGKLGRVFRR